MRLTHAVAFVTMASLAGLLLRPARTATYMAAAGIAGPMDPSLDGNLLKIKDAKPEPATSDRARVAPGPSERTLPAAPEVRQTPAGGETRGESDRSPDGAKEGKGRD